MNAPWRSPLARALHRNRSKPHSHYLQLATVTPQGYPANRTVVFRGFLDNSNCLKFVTDRRSEKIDQIQDKPQAEACWYFTKTREQFRLAGTVEIVTNTDSDSALQLARNTTWQNLSDAARRQFTWSYPGKPREDNQSFSTTNPDPNQPLDNFCLLLLNPFKIDHLELRGSPQNRYLYKLQDDNTWSTQPVNP